MQQGRCVRFSHSFIINSSRFIRYPIDEGNSSMAVPDRSNHVNESISPTISGKVSSLLQPLILICSTDFKAILLGKIIRLWHPDRLRSTSFSRNPTESSILTKLVQQSRFKILKFGNPDMSGISFRNWQLSKFIDVRFLKIWMEN